MAQTLVLGAGFGGISVATELRRRLGDEHEVVLVDRRERFSMGLRKLWELFDLGTIAEGSRSRRLLGEHGIDFQQSAIDGIDPGALAARADGSDLGADFVVVALGAEPRPDLVPGLEEHGHEAWSKEAIPALKRALDAFGGGRIAIAICGAPYPCPPAPYECAFLLDEWLRGRGLREGTEITAVTLQPMLLPNAGREGSDWLAGELAARGIEFQVGRRIERVEEGRAVFADGELPFDLLIAVPPHRVPEVVVASGLAEEGGWIAVDPPTLATSHERVYAVGDVTRITLANGLPLPKAGVIAESEGATVAASIAAGVSGGEPPPPFDGRGRCFLEMGRDEAAAIEGEFLAEPEPRIELAKPSSGTADAKRSFEADRLERWFSSG